MNKIRVYHLEDYQIMRDGIKYLISAEDDIEYVGGVKDPDELLDILKQVPVDVLILDIYLDAMEDVKTKDGFEICEVVTQLYPQIHIVAHSAYEDADRVARILKGGAKGFVSKKSGFDELLTAIRVVNTGKPFICKATSGKLKNVNKFLSGIESTLRSTDEIFSLREREVLDLLSQGKSSKEISDLLFIADRTVETHRKNMIEKAHVKNTAQLIAYGAALGLLKK